MKTVKTLEVTISELINLLPDDLQIKYPYKKENKEGYSNIPFVFDIETTSFYRNINDNNITVVDIESVDKNQREYYEKCNCMYVFVFGFFYNGVMYTCLGRTWKDYKLIIDAINNKYHLKEKECRLIIWVHNLAYEFQYLRFRHTWEKVFALEERKVCYALDNNNIEFRCSYILSGYSLASVGKNLTRYKVEKMEGDLDYKVVRNDKTPLTDKEKGYVYHDGYVVLAFIQESIENTRRNNICDLPLTNTGYVRNFTRKKCLNTTKDDKYKNYKYRKIMSHIQIQDINELQQLIRAFHGGYTHASNYHSGKIMENVTSYDFTSSYPAVAVYSCQFPMGNGQIIKIKNREHFEKCLNTYCCLFDVEFTNLDDKIKYEHPLSLSKCYVAENTLNDNGRVICASRIRTTVTEQDYFVFEKFYKWEKMKVFNFRIYRKGYLPTDFVKAILELYENKTTLKGVVGMEKEYLHSKSMVNAVFGMCATSLLRSEIIYNNGDWSSELPDAEKVINNYNNSMKRFIAYQWGVWITALAFNNLFTGIYACGTDYIYADTDSIKILNADKHLKYIEAYNENVIKQLKCAMDYHKIPFEKCSPKDINGNTHTLGLWDYDGFYTRFRTLGAKRYLCEDKDGELHLTVSGVNKKTCVPYLKKEYKTNDAIFDAFNDGLIVPKGATGKNIHTYIDYEIQGVLKDVYGNVSNYHEYASIHMEETSYNMTMTNEYLDYILGFREFRR